MSTSFIRKSIALLALATLVISAQTLRAECRHCMPATLFSWDGKPDALGPLSPITTDRPDFTEASSTVGLGVAQLEMGYTFTRNAATDAHSWGEPLLRVGVLANWLELRAAVFPVSVASDGTDSGTEDLYLGTKLWLTQQSGWLPEVSLMPQMTVPTGSSAFTADRVLPGVNLLYGWDICEDFSIAGSTQYNRAIGDMGSAYDEWAQSATVGMSITDNIGSYTEWFAIFPSGNAAVSSEHYINGGLTFRFNDDVQFDLRIGKGLTDASDDYFAGVGISLRYR